MNRRNFLKLGGLVSASTATVGLVSTEKTAALNEKPTYELEEFEERQILTAESLNLMIRKINDLQSQINSK